MKILVTDRVHNLLIEGLSRLGDVDYAPDMSYAEVQQVICDYQGLVVNSKIICDKAFLNKANQLLWIGRLGSGLDIFDLKEAERLNIKVINSPEGNANAVGEHTLGMLMALINNIARSARELYSGQWQREANRGVELSGKRVGIIGLGHTGGAFAAKLAGLNVHVVAYDKYLEEVPAALSQVQLVSYPALISLSDVISFHVPLTEETRGMADRIFFDTCRSGAIVMNTSRGQVLNSTDLLKALESGKISGAALDVIENEKPETWSAPEKKLYRALMRHPRVVMTPHIAGWTKESLVNIATVLLDKIELYQKEVIER